MIIILLVVLAIFIIIGYLLTYHIKIKWRTFLRKGMAVYNNQFGVYCFCGKQGRGKTYSVREFLEDYKDKKIYANLTSIKGLKYYYISNFEELLQLRNEHDCIIFYDEIFTALTKNTKMTTDVLNFLSQMRKRKIIFITTAQEWLEINLTLRRYCRYQIECNIRTICGRSFLIKQFYDAEQMKYDNLANEYVAPLLSTTISKMNIKIANSYDTFEQIN